MAVSRLSFYSKALKMNTSVNIILPEYPKGSGKTLLLLHGLGEDENAWLNQTRLTDYASQTDITIIMPRVDRSYYTSRDGDSQYFEYIVQKWRESPKRDTWFKGIFGSPDQVKNSINDINYLITQQRAQTPYILQLCGTDDPFYEMNLALNEQIEQQGLRHEFVAVSGGHEWVVWDKAIQQIIKLIDENAFD